MLRRTFRTQAMRLIAHGMHAASVDPAIVEIEQSTNRDRVVDRFVGKSRLMQLRNIRRPDGNRVFIHFAHKTKQRLFGIAQLRSLKIGKDAFHQLLIFE